jgi:hypothetical protein
MKKKLRIILSIVVGAFLTLSLFGCPGRADAPKEKKGETSQWDKPKDAPAPAQPESTTQEKK